MFKKLHSFFNPEQFQGWGKQRNYFEGWYFKIVNAIGTKAFAIIPGIAMDPEGNKHSFIQLLDGKKRTATYNRFAAEDFVPSSRTFHIDIQKNSFSDKYIRLDIEGVNADLRFSENIGWPKPLYAPGIMGPFAFVPFMECYHGIVSMDHKIDGFIKINNEMIDFNGGRGYIEKDWGRSFPSAYFWMQSNHFSSEGVSLKCAVAKIPWMKSSFTGFIAGLWLHDRLIRFTTYNQSKLRKSFANEKEVEIVLENKNYLLEILVHRDGATQLASPILGFMNGRIEESMTSSVALMLTDKKNKKVLFSDTGINTALEVAGNIREIMV